MGLDSFPCDVPHWCVTCDMTRYVVRHIHSRGTISSKVTWDMTHSHITRFTYVWHDACDVTRYVVRHIHSRGTISNKVTWDMTLISALYMISADIKREGHNAECTSWVQNIRHESTKNDHMHLRTIRKMTLISALYMISADVQRAVHNVEYTSWVTKK